MTTHSKDIRERILYHARAMYTTDENSPIVVQIPIDDLMELIESLLVEARIEGYKKGYIQHGIDELNAKEKK